MPSKKHITGQRFGRLVVKGDGPHVKNRRTVICICDCGSETTVDPRGLFVGHTKSCGCLQKDTVSKLCSERITHGSTRSVEYNTWCKIKSRCQNPRDTKYPDYGARGITVCERWDSGFEAFLADMGRKPHPSASIDRIDVNGNYEPSNCRWASPKEQARNKRNHRMVEHNGQTMPLSQACELSGVNYRSALYRLNHGQIWNPTAPIESGTANVTRKGV